MGWHAGQSDQHQAASVALVDPTRDVQRSYRICNQFRTCK